MTGEVPEEVWEFPKIGSKKQRAIYTPESMTHPAKMDTYLTRRLIKTFTRPHDTILDPMCGVGTTLVESVVLGRNSIGVDIERKFTELTQKNLENVEKVFEKSSFKPKLGKAVVITGDARLLSTLLQQHADAIVTSPPYSQTVGHQGGLDKSDFKHGCRYRENYPKSKENIGNLPEGKIDTVLTSPPFAESKAFHDLEFMKRTSQEQSEKVKKGEIKGHYMTEEARRKVFEEMEKGKTENPDNIANIPYGEVDAILTSPPFSSTTMKKEFKNEKELEEFAKQQWVYKHGRSLEATKRFILKNWQGYPENPENIANLNHGTVDAILTSPPYADIHQCPTNTGLTEFFRKQLKEKGYIEWNGKRYTEAEWRAINHGRIDGRSTPGVKKDAKYSENPQNIGNLPHTENVDVILTSPPYQNTNHDTLEKRMSVPSGKIHIDKKGLPVGYSENPENIGNIKEHGEVDAILTSPPFGESLSNKSGGMKGERNLPNRALSAKGDPQQYSTNPENIGNLTYTNEGLDETIERLREHGDLPKGTVDTILTSPPYGHEATASKPTKLEMKGLFKMGHSKETPLTDEDYRTWEMRSKGNIAKRKLFVRVPCKPEEAQFHDTRKGRKGTIWEWTKEVKVDLNNINVQEQKSQAKGKTETYLEAMFKVYNECYHVLKPKGLMIIVLKNFIRNYGVVDLIGDTVKLCEHIGFKLVKRIKFKLPNVSFWRINYAKQYEKKTGKPFPVEQFESVYLYETVLVFTKQTLNSA